MLATADAPASGASFPAPRSSSSAGRIQITQASTMSTIAAIPTFRLRFGCARVVPHAGLVASWTADGAADPPGATTVSAVPRSCRLSRAMR
jgi:hypothetical protein